MFCAGSIREQCSGSPCSWHALCRCWSAKGLKFHKKRCVFFSCNFRCSYHKVVTICWNQYIRSMLVDCTYSKPFGFWSYIFDTCRAGLLALWLFAVLAQWRIRHPLIFTALLDWITLDHMQQVWDVRIASTLVWADFCLMLLILKLLFLEAMALRCIGVLMQPQSWPRMRWRLVW